MSLVLLSLLACAPHVQVTSSPPGAMLRTARGESLYTPCTTQIPLRPLRRNEVIVSAPGYRTLTLHMHRDLLSAPAVAWVSLRHPVRTLRDEPAGTLHLHLVPEHGPSGTWDPAEEGLREEASPSTWLPIP